MTEKVYEELSLFDYEEIKHRKIETQKGLDEKTYANLLSNYIGTNSDKVQDYIEKYSIDGIFSLPDRFQLECNLSSEQNEQIRNLNKMNKLHKQLSTNNDRYQITSSVAAANYCKNLFPDTTEQEDVYVICLDTKNKVIAAEHCFRGGLNTSVAAPREIMSKAVANRAARIMLAHNHPSNDPKPSDADLHFTKRMKEAGELMGIELLDHIIVGENSITRDIGEINSSDSHYSFAENRVLEESSDYDIEKINEENDKYIDSELTRNERDFELDV